jgi:hypothetical protein
MTQQEYRKTKKGFLVRLYDNMSQRVKGNQPLKAQLYLGKDILSKKDFYCWADSSEFNEIFSKWEESNYDRKLTPTVDRINPSFGYIIENMQWLTHSENSRRSSEYRRDLLLNTYTGVFYDGFEEAGKSVGSNRSQFRQWFIGANKSKKQVSERFVKV